MVTARVGVFVDADNLLPYWRERVEFQGRTAQYLNAADYTQFLTEIEENAEREGNVEVREAYGKWDNKARYIAASLMYHVYGYELQHVPPLSRYSSEGVDPLKLKNAGDILLSSRAILAAATGPTALDTVIIAAADNDYQPLVVELKRLGKRVLCLSFPLKGQQRALLAKVFDDHLVLTAIQRWTQLEHDQEHPPQRSVAPRPVEPTTPPKMLDPRALADLLWTALQRGPVLPAELRTQLVTQGHVDSQFVDCQLSNPFVMKLTSDALVLIDADHRVVPDDAERDTWVPAASRAFLDVIVKMRLRATRLSHPDVTEQIAVVRSSILGCVANAAPDLADRVDMALARGATRLGGAPDRMES